MAAMEPYLFFNGNCEEALNFYAACLDGRLDALMRYEGSPVDEGLPPGWKQRVLHAHFVAAGASFMASDAMPGHPVPPHAGFSLSVSLDDAARARQVFDALAAGGQVTMPFGPPFWGGQFGALTDRFGVPWMVSSP